MNTAKVCMLCVCLGAVICSNAMMRRSGSRTPVTPGSRCQSPLSPVSPVSPHSRSYLSTAPVLLAVRVVTPSVSLSKEQREEIVRQIDQKMCQLSCAQHAD